MRKIINLLVVITLAFCMGACSDENGKNGIPVSTVTFTLSEINNLKEVSYTEASVTYKNLTNAIEKNEKVSIRDNRFALNMPQGLYSISFEAKGTYKLDGKTHNTTFKAQINPATVKGETCALSFNPFVYSENAGFVIEEIFYAGTVYPNTQKPYLGDQYFKITNNSDKALDAGGLTLVETKFNSSTKFDYTPDIMGEAITADAIYSIPSNGEKKYMVQPGASIIICDKATNHKESNPNSFDLSKANFEWYDESTNPKFTDTDNPSVPNLDKIYCNTLTIWIPSQQGNRAYALVDMQEKDGFLEKYKYEYSWKMIIPKTGEEKIMHSSTYKIPNAWVVDAVQLSTPDKHKWNVVNASLDAGYTYCGKSSNDKSKHGKCVRRKELSTTADGRKILQDTNNSTDDFERDAVPSLAD
ncbi:MAG: DUF4876 domain-containing protein [Bacteroides pyogenes]|uniref:DUF4876 domain-containing protein n=1 Tax=Bacteroides pyogenes TaxID=310300 RepID=UPI00242A472A|nr:DUF4876 domain-containing protein [Bacteroides pyogenes]MCI7069697.1 DUF4876 domain-containing protein [Bacteroides pyogenes]